MFDIIGIIGNNLEQKASISVITDAKKEYLSNIDYRENDVKGKNFRIKTLSHSGYENKYFTKDNIHLFLLGNAFSSNNQKDNVQAPAGRLDAVSIYSFYARHGKEFIQYIKGMFLILIFDERSSRYLIFNSRSGMLDMYYYIAVDHLIFSTAIEPILSYEQRCRKLNYVSILEHSIFNYPLGNNTHFEHIYSLDAGSYILDDLKDIKIISYYDIRGLLEEKSSYDWRHVYKEVPSIFNNAVDLCADKTDKICASLTGGFDSRAVISRLCNLDRDILYYSWGMKESVEIKVAAEVARRLKLNYRPILLDKEFLKNYNYFTLQAIIVSDGRATIGRANHCYGYSILSRHSRLFLTGVCGSELLRPANALGAVFNDKFKSLLYSQDRKRLLLRMYGDEEKKGYFKKDIYMDTKEALLHKVISFFEGLDSIEEDYMKLYYFMLKEGMRKYFGTEIHSCRIYGSVDSPYLQDDFIEFILKTPIPALNKKAFRRDSRSLKKGQLIYIPILEKNRPELMAMPTNRFYAPSALKSKYFPISIMPGYSRSWLRRKLIGDDTFNSRRWSENAYVKNSRLFKEDDRLFNRINYDSRHRFEHYDFVKQFSLRVWLGLFCRDYI